MPSIKEIKQYLETLQNLGIKELYREPEPPRLHSPGRRLF
jgi:hypothetical protein